MTPTRSILDPRFRYTPSHRTDIRRTFRKARLLQHLARIKAQKNDQTDER